MRIKPGGKQVLETLSSSGNSISIPQTRISNEFNVENENPKFGKYLKS
jgi:hypothetical protein